MDYALHCNLMDELLAADAAERAAKAAYDKARHATARVRVRVMLSELAARGITSGTEVAGVSWRGVHHGTFMGCSLNDDLQPCAWVEVATKKQRHKLALTHPIQICDLRVYQEGV